MIALETDTEHIHKTHGFLSAAQAALYAEWKRDGEHYEEYASELVGTAFLVFVIVLTVGVMFSPHSPVPAWIPSAPLRRLIAGLIIGGSGWLVAISPPGKLSGAHINPAVTLGFWLLKKMHRRDLGGYLAAQMAGGVLGVMVADWVAARLTGPPIDNSFLAPAPGIGPLGAFGLEALATFVLAGVIYACVSRDAWAKYTPAAVTVAAGLLNLTDGNLSGFGVNPARWFGPALVQHDWSLAWVYGLAPLVGAALATQVPRLIASVRSVPHTAKIVHDPAYRSIFAHDTRPSTPPLAAAVAD